jgi:hypothetical protein
MNELDSWKVLAGIKQQTAHAAPDGSNISITANDKARIMREQNIKPGTDAWFKLWFSKPYLTGERPT